MNWTNSWRKSQVLLPVIHTAIVAALVIPGLVNHWQQRRAGEARYQQLLDSGTYREEFGFDPCIFGLPKPFNALAVADLPALVVGGWGVVPSATSNHLLTQRPGWPLPSTLRVACVGVLLVCVFAQWHLVGLYIKRFHRMIPVLCWCVPLLCVGIGLLPFTGNAYFLRIISLFLWCFVSMAVLVRFKRSSQRSSQFSVNER